MNKVIIIISLIFIANIRPSFAEPELVHHGTLIKIEDVIKSSIQDDVRVKSAEARLKKEEELYQAVKRSVLPHATADLYSALASGDKRGIIFWKPEIRFPIFEGGKWKHEKAKKSYELSGEKLNLEMVRQDVAYQSKAIYIGVLREKENTRLAQEWVKEAEKLYVSMKALLEKGLINQEASYRWEAAFRSAQQELVKHKEAMDYGEALLREITMLSDRERIEPEILSDLAKGQFEFQNSLSEMKNRNPLYEIIKLRAKAKEEEIKILRSERFPKLGFSTRFNLARDSFIDQNRFEIGVVSSWNIWDFGVLSHEIKAKEAETEEMRYEGDVQTNELEHELRKIVADLKVGWAKISASQSLLREKKETYSNDKTRLIAAERSESQLFDSFVAFTQAQMMVVEAFSEYRLLQAHFEKLIGSEVSVSGKN